MSIEKLFFKINLGEIVNQPERVSGGFQHKLYKVVTDQASYAVKEIGKQKTHAEFLKQLEINEKISYDLNAKGIHTIPAILVNGKVVQKIKDTYYVIYPWFDGKPLKNSEFSLHYSNQAGSILGKIHKEQISAPETPEIMPLAYEKFCNLEDSLPNKIPELSNAIKYLEELNAQYISYKAQLNYDVIFSHCDMDQKNTMLKDDILYVIEWEDAGTINQTEELINTALSWAGFHNKNVQENLFKEFIQSYKKEYPSDFKNIHEAFIVCLASWVNWVKFNIKALSKNNSNQSAKEQIIKTIDKIYFFENNLEIWESWLNNEISK